MTPSRRRFLTSAAAASAAVVTPETVWAAMAQDVAAPWALATVDLEADVAPRAMRLVHGRAPIDLTGTLFRNGPGKFRRPGGSATHWFDGDGLMRAFRVQGGTVMLDARFADTPKRRWEGEIEAVVTPGFGTVGDPRARIGSPDDANAANTAVMVAGNEVWALWEGGSPLSMDPADLTTRGFVTLRDDLKGMPFQAHPRRAPDGTIWNVGTQGDKAVVWHMQSGGELISAGLVTLPRASYLHDFTATERSLVFVLQPWVFERPGMPYASQFAWKPEMGTQVLVVDKADLSRTRLFDLPAFSFFHLGDAWEEADGTIRFDVAANKDASFAIEGARVLVAQRGVVPGEPSMMKLITLHADGRAEMASTGVTGEFPRSDPRRPCSRRRLTAHVHGERSDRPLPNGLAVQDWETGRSSTFLFDDVQIVEEAVFVPRPGRTAEDEAWLVAPSINLAEGVTELHAFDVARIADGPVATWRADVALPAGFHGTWAG
ncbi:MAG: carotenoid oxygenase family protein [Caulobacteraceae bacterium]|nr:carotenoid oxygenase family protein [Caulobacteraceae bacterium]